MIRRCRRVEAFLVNVLAAVLAGVIVAVIVNRFKR
jgi:hypothetical protein